MFKPRFGGPMNELVFWNVSQTIEGGLELDDLFKSLQLKPISDSRIL